MGKLLTFALASTKRHHSTNNQLTHIVVVSTSASITTSRDPSETTMQILHGGCFPPALPVPRRCGRCTADTYAQPANITRQLVGRASKRAHMHTSHASTLCEPQRRFAIGTIAHFIAQAIKRTERTPAAHPIGRWKLQDDHEP